MVDYLVKQEGCDISHNTVLPEVIIIHTFAVPESHEYRDMATGTVMSSYSMSYKNLICLAGDNMGASYKLPL